MLLPRIPIQIVAQVHSPQEWRGHSTAEGDFVFDRLEKGTRVSYCPGKEIRDAALLIKTPDDLYGFLTQYGDPGINPTEYIGTRDYKLRDGTTMAFKQHIPRRTIKVFLGQFLEVQRALKRAMDTNVENWNFGGVVNLEEMLDDMVVELKFHRWEVMGICRIDNLVRACFACVFLEKLVENINYGWCQECGKYYLRNTQHERKFCSPSCGAKVALRAFRERRNAKLYSLRVRGKK